MPDTIGNNEMVNQKGLSLSNRLYSDIVQNDSKKAYIYSSNFIKNKIKR